MSIRSGQSTPQDRSSGIIQHTSSADAGQHAASLSVGAVPRQGGRSFLDHVRRSILPDHEDGWETGSPVGGPPSPAARVRSLLPKVVLALTAILLLLAIALFAFRALYSDRIYPAVVVGDVNVGGLTPNAAQAALVARADQLETSTITFAYGDQVWTPTLTELGATVHLDEALGEAQALGRTGDAVDRAAATDQILAALGSLTPVDGALPTMVDVPEIRAADLNAVKDEVQVAVSTPIRVTFENQAWQVEGETLAQYASAETVLEDGQPVAKLSLDTERLAADLRAEYGPEVNRSPVDARVGWDGGLVSLDDSVTGIELRSTAFAEALEASFLSGHERVEVPVVEVRPTIDSENLGALGITELLGRGDSNFYNGTWARNENIRVATGLLNGALVPPGGMFSFNSAIGEITYDKGYQEASVVVAEQVGKDIGGGVCQVSTTVFRAALMAGMPIAEWHPHTYRLPGYEGANWPAGFDASILQMGEDPQYWGDFKFENYSDSWLLVESWVNGESMTVNIYGTSDGREVDLQVWSVDEPNDAAFTRVITDSAGEVIAEREFYSPFK